MMIFYGPMGGGGGGGGGEYYLRNVSKEWPVIKKWGRRTTENLYPRFTRKEPIVRQQYERALKSPILAELGTQGLAQLKEGPSPILSELQSQASEELASGGALSPAEKADVWRTTLARAGQTGTTWTPATVGAGLLEEDKVRRQRESEGRTFAAGIEGLSESDVSRRFGLATGAEQARFQLPQSTLAAGTQAFTGFQNPILAYLGQAFTPTPLAAPAGGGDKGGQLGGAALGAAGTVAAAAI